MNRINQAFKAHQIFAAYITAGDGSLNHQMNMIRALIKGGVNLLEIGIPFSDPIADGPVIQAAMQRALAAKTTLKEVIELIAAVRKESEIPIIVFTYYNPVIARRVPPTKQSRQKIGKLSLDCFESTLAMTDVYEAFKSAGADGILVIDLPFSHAADHLKACAELDLVPIPVVTPSTTPDRLKMLAQLGKGFLYYACQKGTTGVRNSLPADLQSNIQNIKNITSLPVIVGFGIADRNASQAALEVADGIVVGSYFIDAIQSGISPLALTSLANELLIG